MARGVGIGVTVATILALAVMPRSSDGFPVHEVWVGLLIYLLGPLGVVVWLSSFGKLNRRILLFAVLIAPLTYLAAVLLFALIAINLGVIYP